MKDARRSWCPERGRNCQAEIAPPSANRRKTDFESFASARI
jgi:hypothetical protein